MNKNTFSLNSTLAKDSPADPEDTLNVKRKLHQSGFMGMPSYGLDDMPDKPMFDGIKKFQTANKLKVDGIMKPGGETEKVITSYSRKPTQDPHAIQKKYKNSNVERQDQQTNTKSTDYSGYSCEQLYGRLYVRNPKAIVKLSNEIVAYIQNDQLKCEEKKKEGNLTKTDIECLDGALRAMENDKPSEDKGNPKMKNRNKYLKIINRYGNQHSVANWVLTLFRNAETQESVVWDRLEEIWEEQDNLKMEYESRCGQYR